jgi:LemA protein
MVTAFIVLFVLMGAVGLLALFAIGKYNCLVSLRNRYKNAFAQVDLQLTRRHELICNLALIAESSLKHERKALEALISARNAAYTASAKAAANPGDPKAMRELSIAEADLNSDLGRFLAVAEAYGDLKMPQSQFQLREQLAFTEKEISLARQVYNDAVIAYNSQRKMLAARLVAKASDFAAAELFIIRNTPQEATPQASFT